jgi:hypothetical protein
MKLDIGDLMKIFQGISDLVKIRQSVWLSTQPKYTVNAVSSSEMISGCY